MGCAPDKPHHASCRIKPSQRVSERPSGIGERCNLWRWRKLQLWGRSCARGWSQVCLITRVGRTPPRLIPARLSIEQVAAVARQSGLHASRKMPTRGRPTSWSECQLGSISSERQRGGRKCLLATGSRRAGALDIWRGILHFPV